MKILLVEDHDALRHNIEAVLKSEGYTVVSCADGIDAEFQIVNNSSDLILLDRMLPGQNSKGAGAGHYDAYSDAYCVGQSWG